MKTAIRDVLIAAAALVACLLLARSCDVPPPVPPEEPVIVAAPAAPSPEDAVPDPAWTPVRARPPAAADVP